MKLDILPVRVGSAAENMALDLLLLQRYVPSTQPRFRHYGWRSPAWTFGYGQKIAWVRAQLPAEERLEICRRPTGGGLVDHRDDWTYSLVIPRGHPLEELRATQSYRLIHEALAEALRTQHVAAVVKPPASLPDAEAPAGPEGVCFQRAEVSDVVHAVTGEKIAGAAQKRNKHGLLFQGSIARTVAGPQVDWEGLHDDFSAKLATALTVTPQLSPWPELHEDEVSALQDHYASPEWIEYR